jgi:hypothetical protein
MAKKHKAQWLYIGKIINKDLNIQNKKYKHNKINKKLMTKGS